MNNLKVEELIRSVGGNKAFNELISDAYFEKTAAGEEIGKTINDLIKTEFREAMFLPSIITPKTITPDDLDQDPAGRSLMLYIEIEPELSEEVIYGDFLAEAETRRVRGDKAPVYFYKVISPEIEFTKEELWAYKYPFTEVIKNRLTYNFEKAIEKKFVDMCRSATNSTGQQTAASFGATGFSFKKAVMDMINFIDTADKPLKVEKMLFPVKLYNELLTLPASELGDELFKETFIKGYNYDTFMNRPFLTTNKKDVVAENEVFGFTNEDYLGKFFYLNEDLTFWHDVEKNIASFQVWSNLGMSIINPKAVAKLELNS
jgi:hypothetical protein